MDAQAWQAVWQASVQMWVGSLMAQHSLSWYAASSMGVMFGVATGLPGIVFINALVVQLKKRRDFQNRGLAHVG